MELILFGRRTFALVDARNDGWEFVGWILIIKSLMHANETRLSSITIRHEQWHTNSSQPNRFCFRSKHTNNEMFNSFDANTTTSTSSPNNLFSNEWMFHFFVLILFLAPFYSKIIWRKKDEIGGFEFVEFIVEFLVWASGCLWLRFFSVSETNLNLMFCLFSMWSIGDGEQPQHTPNRWRCQWKENSQQRKPTNRQTTSDNRLTNSRR